MSVCHIFVPCKIVGKGKIKPQFVACCGVGNFQHWTTVQADYIKRGYLKDGKRLFMYLYFGQLYHSFWMLVVLEKMSELLIYTWVDQVL